MDLTIWRDAISLKEFKVDYDELDEKEKRRVGIEIKKRKNARLQPISSDK